MPAATEVKVSLYEVGGSVRDRYMGRESHDEDFSAVVENGGWPELLQWADQEMDEVFLVTPEFLTIRGKKDGKIMDVVMARKEDGYSDGRHPDNVEPGTIDEDLARRDFTMNAMACKSELFLDLFGGAEDIDNRLIRCVGYAADRFREDALRAIRAMRFSITLGFDMDEDIRSTLETNFMPDIKARKECGHDHYFNENEYLSHQLASVSPERIREELKKMFAHDTIEAGSLLFGNHCTKAGFHRASSSMYSSASLNIHEDILDVLFPDGGIWLEPTLKQT